MLGVPGALIGGLLVEIPKFGRKGALAVSTVLTGVFLYASTTAKNSDALLGWNCAYNFCSNVMYAVLYGYTPEVSEVLFVRVFWEEGGFPSEDLLCIYELKMGRKGKKIRMLIVEI